jgi:hypothetical protein
MADETQSIETTPAQPAGQDGLDSAIASLEASIAEAQAQTPTADASQARSGQQAPPEQPAGDTAQEPGGTEESEEDEGLEPPSQEQPGKPTSRMGRLRQQLSQAEQKARDAETRLQQRQAVEQHALRQFVDLVLPDAELEALRVKAENGDWEAKQRVDLARQWRQMAAPIADLAHQAARREFDLALDGMRTLDGMDGDSHQKLLTAPTPGDKLKLMWQLGKKLSDDSHKERIAELEQEVQALKTNKTANGSQPAAGGAPRNGTAIGLAGLIGPDGLLTDEAMRLSPAEVSARFGVAS